MTRLKKCAEEYISVEGLILFNLVLSYVLFSSLHICGASVPRTAFITASALCLLLSFLRGWRFGLAYIGVYMVCLFATCYTFSYIDSDAITVHYPCQALLMEGWNPVYERTADEILRYGVDGYRWSSYIAFMPKITAACGAMVASTFELFAGDAFLGYALFIALFLLSFRFAVVVWPTINRMARVVFAMAMIFSPQLVSIFSGRVDYTVYAAIITAVLSAALIYCEKDRRHYLVFFSAIVIAATSKALAVVFSTYILIGFGFVCRKVRSVRWLLFASVTCILICGCSPFFTAWATQETINITEDFVANADGIRMGIVGRTVYAWFSKWLAVKGCAIVFFKPDFSPSLACLGGGNLEGFGTFFRALMVLSAAALVFSKRTIVFWVAIFIFITSNLIPPKYIGFSRYVPQMIVVPALAFYNFAFAPRESISRCRDLMIYARVGIVLFIAVFHGMFCLRSLAIGVRYLALEADRQKAIREIKAQGMVRLPSAGNRFVLLRRLLAGGVSIAEDESSVQLPQMSMLMILDMKDPEARQRAMDEKFPYCFTFSDARKFNWVEALSNMPKPIVRADVDGQ